MPWKRKGKCVYKKNKNSKKLGKKQGCSTSISKAKKYLSALYANSEDVVEEKEIWAALEATKDPVFRILKRCVQLRATD